jgi:Ca2+-binding EF-hand superfamily protein
MQVDQIKEIKTAGNKDYVDFEDFRASKNLDINAFQTYLKEIYKDLADRRDSKKSGVSNLTFMEYMKLPVFLCEKVFSSFDLDCDTFLNQKEFNEGLINLYFGNFDETSKILFNIYDIDKDGKINPGDMKIILSYLPVRTDKTKTDYKFQMESIQEIENIIDETFGSKKTLKYSEYCDIITNVKSDSYFQLLCFLFQRRPFNDENVNLYKAKFEKKKSELKADIKLLSPSPNSKPKKLLSPSRNSLLSPVRNFFELNLQGEDEFNLKANEDETNGSTIPVHKKMSFMDKGNAPEVSGYKGVVRMNNQKVEKVDSSTNGNKDIKKVIENSENKFNSPSTFLKKGSDLPEFNLEDNMIDLNESSEVKNLEDILYKKEKKMDYKKDDKIQFEDYIYKVSENGKLKKYYLVLTGKDILYYKTNAKDIVEGMHNLSGTYIQENGEKKIEGKTFYMFSVIFSSKTRIYYCPDKEVAKQWTSCIRKAIGYENFFDHYEMLDDIGEGKFGLVKLGLHGKTKQKVAIKIIKKEAMTINDLELVKGEIDIMKLCRHPNVVRLLDHFENSEFIFIVMEYLSGGDLGNHLQVKKFQFTEKRAAEIMYQIGCGLNYLHHYGVLHRDLKPDNIMLSDKTDKATIKIMDFGLSKVLAPNERVSDGFGTLSFVAPEVLIRQPYNKQIDIWSMGVIMYYMLTSNLPFDDQDDNEEKIAKMIVFNEVEFPEKLFKDRSAELIDLIGLCLIKNPDKRITVENYLKHPWIKKFNQ